ncbi:glycopeptide antibiotics resistance protein [Cryobacterium sp. MP_M3]|uniref:VanZ family protein n=1 Tax=unclassified Cryobacterium TaxID=2649013 RepID=UPI0018CB7D93|nr:MULTISPECIES: VanZ family protein [unclassified Cryobacterium]MBG6057010.1 glycopeptide antibiotics resistance protein [Cryobacterium sp. MP_M3]
MSNLEPPKSRAREWLTSLALVASLTIVLLATMWPTPLDQGYSASIEKLLAVLQRHGLPGWFGYNKLEFSANVMMFVPLGFLLTMLLPVRVWWLALVVCPALSVSIELTQASFLSARFATLSDVVANSIGAIVGAFFAVVLRAIVHARDERLIARALWQSGLRS